MFYSEALVIQVTSRCQSYNNQYFQGQAKLINMTKIYCYILIVDYLTYKLDTMRMLGVKKLFIIGYILGNPRTIPGVFFSI